MKKRLQSTQKRRVGFFEYTPRNRVVAELLGANGYEAVFPSDDSGGAIDLWIACITNPSEARAAEGFRAARRQGALVALVCRCSGETARQVAKHCESLDPEETIYLDHPDALSDLIDAVFEILGQDTPPDLRFDGPRLYTRSYEADETGTNNCAYELAAFLTEKGVAHAHRIRIVSAAYEATDNVRRHAYGADSGTFSIEIEVDRTRIHIGVIDRGNGFDAGRVKADSVPAALPTSPRADLATQREERRAHDLGYRGLQRLAALTEESDVQSDENGTRVEMVFELTPVRFEEEPEGFADVDFLAPDRARELVQALKEGVEVMGDIAPALALTVGRLLNGAQRGF